MKEGTYALCGAGGWTRCLNQDAFAELHAGNILTACCLVAPDLALGVACFCE